MMGNLQQLLSGPGVTADIVAEVVSFEKPKRGSNGAYQRVKIRQGGMERWVTIFLEENQFLGTQAYLFHLKSGYWRNPKSGANTITLSGKCEPWSGQVPAAGYQQQPQNSPQPQYPQPQLPAAAQASDREISIQRQCASKTAAEILRPFCGTKEQFISLESAYAEYQILIENLAVFYRTGNLQAYGFKGSVNYSPSPEQESVNYSPSPEQEYDKNEPMEGADDIPF